MRSSPRTESNIVDVPVLYRPDGSKRFIVSVLNGEVVTGKHIVSGRRCTDRRLLYIFKQITRVKISVGRVRPVYFFFFRFLVLRY